MVREHRSVASRIHCSRFRHSTRRMRQRTVKETAKSEERLSVRSDDTLNTRSVVGMMKSSCFTVVARSELFSRSSAQENAKTKR